MESSDKLQRHSWICTKAGMFVSYFQCKHCGQETRTSDPHDKAECSGPNDEE